MFNGTRHFHDAIQPLCARALDLDAGAREAWLDELRADCPTVVRALERLIKPVLDSCPAHRAAPATSHVLPGSPEHLGLRW
jgi:hypothetical protein